MAKVPSGNCLVASTPYTKSRVKGLLDDLIPELSPIAQPVTETETSKDSQQSTTEKEKENIKGKRYAGKLLPQTILPVKRKNGFNDKGSSILAGSVEHSVGQIRQNVLSHSLNKYNLYPEPIILDSDEETCEVLTTGRKNNVTKKNKPSEKTGTPEAVKKKVTKRKFLESCDETAKPAKVKLSKDTTKAQPSAAVKTQPSSQSSTITQGEVMLENVTNTNIEKKAKKCIKRPKKKLVPVLYETPDHVINNDEDLFSSYLPNMKVPVSVKKILNSRSIIELSDDDIKWTPRRAKTRDLIKPVDHESDVYKEAETLDTAVPIDKITEKLETVLSEKQTEDIASISKASTLVDEEHDSEDSPAEKKFPEECLTLFKDVIFHRNKGSGGLVAKCFQTNHNTFGYVEVEEGKAFTGRKPNITFIVLEGSVKVSQLSVTQILVEGDILHLNLESEYKFVPYGPGHARLLYVKEK